MHRLKLAIVPLMLALASCTTSAYDLMPTGSIPSGLGDSDPQDFGKRPPSSYPIHGVDVSKWQGDIDWKKAHASGVSFAFIKATEGGDRVDPRFDDYWQGARAARIAVAPYHFYYFCTPALEQANWFIHNVPKGALVMPPVIDIEWNPNSPTCHRRPAPEVVRRDLKAFADRIERYYGRKPIIYTTIDFYSTNLAGYFNGDSFWLRSVAAHPDSLYDGRDWTFWQYTGTGIVPGIRGKADISVFDGDVEAWEAWLSAAG